MLVTLDAGLQALTVRLQQAAPAGLPLGLGQMTWELLQREVGDWHRFRNRRQVAVRRSRRRRAADAAVVDILQRVRTSRAPTPATTLLARYARV